MNLSREIKHENGEIRSIHELRKFFFEGSGELMFDDTGR
jgi:hypothetical protein